MIDEKIQERIISFIEELKNKNISFIDEAATKQTIVLRLFYILGWNIFDSDEVIPEYIVGTDRIDYALKIGDSKVFVEVKKIGENLDNCQEQLLNYSFKEGINLAVLTNGIVWRFYLSLYEGDWKDRRFYTINLFKQDPKDVADKFIEFISKDSINSGDAIKNAALRYEEQKKFDILRGTIPKSWNKIITEFDANLICLIKDTAEKICGFIPEDEMIKQFLSINNLKVLEIQPDNSLKNARIKIMNPENSHLLVDDAEDDYVPNIDCSGKSPDSFEFKGYKLEVATWKNLLTNLLHILYTTHKDDFDKILGVKLGKNSKRIFFSRNKNRFHVPFKIEDTDIYLETKITSNDVVRLSYQVIREFGYYYDDLKINVC